MSLIMWVCTDHDDHWPVGVASIVWGAVNVEEARKLLDAELKNHSLKGYAESPYTLKEIDLTKPTAIVLCDGNY